MSKKKDKPQVINNIGELNLEIDYDKLADAIVKAQERSEDEANKRKEFISGTFASVIGIAFYGLSIFSGLLCVASLIAVYNILSALQKDVFWPNIITVFVLLVFATVFASYCILLWKSAREIKREKDRNYIVSVFSGIVSFAALIVALVAFFKEVG